MDIEKCVKQLELRGHKVSVFDTKEDALAYMSSQIYSTEVGIGGCLTAEQMGLYDELCKNNKVYWHWKSQEPNTREKANAAPVYITGVNAMSEDGDIMNIDGMGNRLAGQVYGKKKVYFLAGINKICPDFASALERARNVAAVCNAKRFNTPVPCTGDGKCHDCRTADRLCRALLVIWGPMKGGMETEVVIIKEELGY